MGKINVAILCDRAGFPVNTGMVCEEADFEKWCQNAAMHGGVTCPVCREKHGKLASEYQKGLPVKEE